jgi:uncharacterized protein YcgL (UPF0745 family)
MCEAAGTASGIALDAHQKGADVDIAELQKRLENQGAYLGRTDPEPLL